MEGRHPMSRLTMEARLHAERLGRAAFAVFSGGPLLQDMHLATSLDNVVATAAHLYPGQPITRDHIDECFRRVFGRDALDRMHAQLTPIDLSEDDVCL